MSRVLGIYNFGSVLSVKIKILFVEWVKILEFGIENWWTIDHTEKRRDQILVIVIDND